MEQAAIKAYSDWNEEDQDPVAEMLRMKADEARSPSRTWLMPVVDTIDRCIRERFCSRILQEMNDRLVNGELSLLLGRAVISERIAPRDMEIGGVSCWRLNRTDFLADIDMTLGLTVEEKGRDVSGRYGFCLGLWFCTEDGFEFEVQELHLLKDSRVIRVAFNGGTAYQPLIASLAIDCGVKANILGADTRNIDGKAFGTMLLGLPDNQDDANRALQYIRSQPNVTVEEVQDYHV